MLDFFFVSRVTIESPLLILSPFGGTWWLGFRFGSNFRFPLQRFTPHIWSFGEAAAVGDSISSNGWVFKLLGKWIPSRARRGEERTTNPQSETNSIVPFRLRSAFDVVVVVVVWMRYKFSPNRRIIDGPDSDNRRQVSIFFFFQIACLAFSLGVLI